MVTLCVSLIARTHCISPNSALDGQSSLSWVFQGDGYREWCHLPTTCVFGDVVSFALTCMSFWIGQLLVGVSPTKGYLNPFTGKPRRKRGPNSILILALCIRML